MKAKEYPTKKFLEERFIYKNGELFYKKGFRRYSSKNISKNYYSKTTINGIRYYTHRLIYIYHNGLFPSSMCIDHEDRNISNNKIENLRLLSHQQNSLNNNAKGYYYRKSINKYHSQIVVNGEKVYLGLYITEKKAGIAYAEAKKKFHIISGYIS